MAIVSLSWCLVCAVSLGATCATLGATCATLGATCATLGVTLVATCVTLRGTCASLGPTCVTLRATLGATGGGGTFFVVLGESWGIPLALRSTLGDTAGGGGFEGIGEGTLPVRVSFGDTEGEGVFPRAFFGATGGGGDDLVRVPLAETTGGDDDLVRQTSLDAFEVMSFGDTEDMGVGGGGGGAGAGVAVRTSLGDTDCGDASLVRTSFGRDDVLDMDVFARFLGLGATGGGVFLLLTFFTNSSGGGGRGGGERGGERGGSGGGGGTQSGDVASFPCLPSVVSVLSADSGPIVTTFDLTGPFDLTISSDLMVFAILITTSDLPVTPVRASDLTALSLALPPFLQPLPCCWDGPSFPVPALQREEEELLLLAMAWFCTGIKSGGAGTPAVDSSPA